MKTLIKTLETLEPQSKRLESVYSDNLKQPAFLQGVIEGLIDGILILTDQGKWIHANESAKRICCQLAGGVPKPNFVPEAIWHICKALIESRSLFPNQQIILSEEIVTGNSTTFRIRARWLDLAQIEHPYLLVTMEDRSESVQNMASAEAQKYGLTAREKDVWSLYRANYSYKEIADELYITLNTVKKHMKNIHAKRHVILDTFELEKRRGISAEC